MFQETVSISSNGGDSAGGLKGRCYDNHRRSLVYRGFLPSRVVQHRRGNKLGELPVSGQQRESQERERQGEVWGDGERGALCTEQQKDKIWRYIQYMYVQCELIGIF